MFAGMCTAGCISFRIVELALAVGDDQSLVFRVEVNIHSHVWFEAKQYVMFFSSPLP